MTTRIINLLELPEFEQTKITKESRTLLRREMAISQFCADLAHNHKELLQEPNNREIKSLFKAFKRQTKYLS